MKHIDSWEDASWVYVWGPETFMTVLSVIVAAGLFVFFLVKMIRHENHAYAQMIAHEPVEPGPAAEGEPTVY
jgi:hypothetical protein